MPDGDSILALAEVIKGKTKDGVCNGCLKGKVCVKTGEEAEDVQLLVNNKGQQETVVVKK